MDHIPLLPGTLSLSLALVSILEHFILELKTVYPGSIYRVKVFLLYIYHNKKVLIFRFDDICINRTEIKAPNFARPVGTFRVLTSERPDMARLVFH